jgi:uncharacterized protein (TIGR03382 family)
VINVNKPPVAAARHVAGDTSGQPITLDSVGSSDPDGEMLTYKWEQTDGPSVTLSSSSDPTVSFTAPTTDKTVTLGFKLTVTDGHGASASKTLSVDINPAKDEGGCSSTGNASGGAMLIALLAGVALSRRRITLRA